MANNERMQKVREMLEKQPEDVFLMYAMAMELRKAGELQEAVEYLTRVTRKDVAYIPAYHQMGQVHTQAGKTAEARDAYQRGIAVAMKAGNRHAAEEMQAELDML